MRLYINNVATEQRVLNGMCGQVIDPDPVATIKWIKGRTPEEACLDLNQLGFAFAVRSTSLFGADDCNLVLVVTGGKLGATFDTFSEGNRP